MHGGRLCGGGGNRRDVVTLSPGNPVTETEIQHMRPPCRRDPVTAEAGKREREEHAAAVPS